MNDESNTPDSGPALYDGGDEGGDHGRGETLACLKEAEGDLAYTDDLTGLFNKRLLTRMVEEWWPGIIGEFDVVSLIVIDLDGFKDVNDTWGHLTGDEVLRITAQILVNHFRTVDVVIRYGGDEFVVVLPGVGEMQAELLADRARSAIIDHRFAVSKTNELIQSPISFSAGIACFPDDGYDGTALLDLADRRLYAEKHERSSAHRTRKSMIRLALSSAVALAITAVIIVAFTDPFGWRAEPPAGVDASATAEREAELLATIEQLQAQIAELTTQTAEQPNDEVEGRIAAMTERISGLQNELERLKTDDVPATATPIVETLPTRPLDPTPIPTAPPTPTPVPTRTPRPAPTPAAAEIAPPVFVPPELIGFDKPRYPEIARRMEREASLRFKVLVDERGQVIEVEPLGDRAGFGFDEEARKAAFSARYRPGTRNGVPTKLSTVLLIQFSMRD